MEDHEYMHGSSAYDITPNDAPDWAYVWMVLAGVAVLVVCVLGLSALAALMNGA